MKVTVVTMNTKIEKTLDNCPSYQFSHLNQKAFIELGPTFTPIEYMVYSVPIQKLCTSRVLPIEYFSETHYTECINIAIDKPLQKFIDTLLEIKIREKDEEIEKLIKYNNKYTYATILDRLKFLFKGKL